MIVRGGNATRIAWILAALGLALWIARDASRDFPNQPAIDLYHPWGIALAHSAPGIDPNPYVDTAGYARALNGIDAHATSGKLHIANQFWNKWNPRGIEPTGTPLFYASFGFLPADFDRAHLLWAVLQFLSAGLAVFLLARLKSAGILPAACLALLVLATYNPFTQDVKMGNVNALQLLGVAALLYVAARRLYLRAPTVDAVYLAVLALFLAFKPNTIFVVAGLACHYALARGVRRAFLGIGFALAALLLAYGYSAWYFHDAGVWRDWLRYTQGVTGGTLLYSLDKGNQSLTMLMAQRSGAFSPYGYALIVAAVLALVLYAAMTDSGKRNDLFAPTARRLLADPWFAASAGVIFTFATSPLLWVHYHLFALVPVFWLYRTYGRHDFATACAIASYLAVSRPLITLLIGAELYGIVHSMIFFSWVPLVVGLLSRAAAERRALAAPAQAATRTFP